MRTLFSKACVRVICFLLTAVLALGTVFAEEAEIASETVTIAEESREKAPSAKEDKEPDPKPEAPKPAKDEKEDEPSGGQDPVVPAADKDKQDPGENAAAEEKAAPAAEDKNGAGDEKAPSEEQTEREPEDRPSEQGEEPAEEAEPVSADEPEVPAENEAPAEEKQETKQDIRVDKLSLVSGSTVVAEGEKATVTLCLKVKNANGAKLKDFIVQIRFKDAAEGETFTRRVKNAVVRNGELRIRNNPLDISAEFTPIGSNEQATAIVTLRNCDEERTLIEKAQLVFTSAPAGADEETVGEQIESAPAEGEQAEPASDADDEPYEFESEEVIDGEPETEEEPSAGTEGTEPAEEAGDVIPAGEENDGEAEQTEEEGETEPAEEEGEAEPAEEEGEVETAEEDAEAEPAEETEEEPFEVDPLEAETEENGKIELGLQLNADPSTLADGDTLVLTAVVTGAEEGTYAIRWQCDGGCGNWQDIEGQTGERISVTVSEEVRGFSWRYLVDMD